MICRLGGDLSDDDFHYKLHVKIPGIKGEEIGKADVDLTSNISENEYFK